MKKMQKIELEMSAELYAASQAAGLDLAEIAEILEQSLIAILIDIDMFALNNAVNEMMGRDDLTKH